MWDNSLETVHETGKTVIKSIDYAFNPFATSPFETKEKQTPQQEMQKKLLEQQKDGQKSTPLDFEKLQ